jgi:dolichyl-phosphate-mannose-protein mannosyltransferase
MRALGAFFGTLVVPIAYMTIRDCGHSNLAALIAALSLCFGKNNSFFFYIC